jgi:hypothetical protein
MLAALGCGAVTGLTDQVTGLVEAPALWDDVPRMDGLTASEDDLPLPVRVLLRTLLPTLLSQGQGNSAGDWVMFSTDQAPDDIQAFYTNERMAEAGWEASDVSTCTTGAVEGLTESGLICVFQKQEGDRYTGLAVIGLAAAEAGRTNVIFIRVEADQTPTP